MTPEEVGKWLADGASDEEFAEALVWYEQYRKNGSAAHCIAADMNNCDVEGMMDNLRNTMNEILFSEDICSNAWWKGIKEYTIEAYSVRLTEKNKSMIEPGVSYRLGDCYEHKMFTTTDKEIALAKIEAFKSQIFSDKNEDTVIYTVVEYCVREDIIRDDEWVGGGDIIAVSEMPYYTLDMGEIGKKVFYKGIDSIEDIQEKAMTILSIIPDKRPPVRIYDGDKAISVLEQADPNERTILITAAIDQNHIPKAWQQTEEKNLVIIHRKPNVSLEEYVKTAARMDPQKIIIESVPYEELNNLKKYTPGIALDNNLYGYWRDPDDIYIDTSIRGRR
ncbi:MAG: hypothetical protein IJ619_09145 [Eubacterium sp.]|nr:hypothetical protein [Eubacterium sp.]